MGLARVNAFPVGRDITGRVEEGYGGGGGGGECELKRQLVPGSHRYVMTPKLQYTYGIPGV